MKQYGVLNAEMVELQLELVEKDKSYQELKKQFVEISSFVDPSITIINSNKERIEKLKASE